MPENGVSLAMSQFSSSTYFSAEQARHIRHGNAMAVFPRIARKIKYSVRDIE